MPADRLRRLLDGPEARQRRVDFIDWSDVGATTPAIGALILRFKPNTQALRLMKVNRPQETGPGAKKEGTESGSGSICSGEKMPSQ